MAARRTRWRISRCLQGAPGHPEQDALPCMRCSETSKLKQDKRLVLAPETGLLSDPGRRAAARASSGTLRPGWRPSEAAPLSKEVKYLALEAWEDLQRLPEAVTAQDVPIRLCYSGFWAPVGIGLLLKPLQDTVPDLAKKSVRRISQCNNQASRQTIQQVCSFRVGPQLLNSDIVSFQQTEQRSFVPGPLAGVENLTSPVSPSRISKSSKSKRF